MTCPLCNSAIHLTLEGIQDNMNHIRFDGKLYACNNKKCSLVFIHPLPDRETIATFYHSYYTHNHDSVKDYPYTFSFLQKLIFKLGNILFSAVQFEKQQENFYTLNLEQPTVNTNKLLEIGCGSGERLKVLRDLGWETTGQEIDVNTRKSHEANNLHVVYGGIETLDLSKEFFDVIVLNHVLEHLDDPISVLNRCAELLKDTGCLVLATPNSKSFGAKMFKQFWVGFDFPRHLFIYSSDSLKHLIEKTNFSVRMYQTVPWNTETFSAMSLEAKEVGHFTLNEPKSPQILSSAFICRMRAYFKWIFNKESGDELFFVLGKKESQVRSK